MFYSSAIIIAFITLACSTAKIGTEDVFKEHVTDSVLVESLSEITIPFVYSMSKHVCLKASKQDYLQQINDMTTELSDSAYKEAYAELRQILEDDFGKKDSINLDRIRSSKVAIYPLIELVKKQNLYIYDTNTEQVQDSIYRKNYVRQKFDQYGNLEKTYSGESYTTIAGHEFIRILIQKR